MARPTGNDALKFPVKLPSSRPQRQHGSGDFGNLTPPFFGGVDNRDVPRHGFPKGGPPLSKGIGVAIG